MNQQAVKIEKQIKEGLGLLSDRKEWFTVLPTTNSMAENEQAESLEQTKLNLLPIMI